MHDAQKIRPGHMDGGVNGEAGYIDVAGGFVAVLDNPAVQVDAHEIRGPHILEVHAELIDQEMMLRPRKAGADMGVDEVGPAVVRDEPVERGEVAAGAPLELGDTFSADWSGGDVHCRCPVDDVQRVE